MEDNKQEIEIKHIPEIYCALSVLLDKSINVADVINELQIIGICDVIVRKPKCEPLICFDVAVVQYEHFWEINSALEKMFSKIDSCIYQLKNLVVKHSGEIYIDIAFFQYGTYPALVFSGNTMKKIRYLEASISIDPFDCRES